MDYEEEIDRLSNWCCDLLALKRMEPGLRFFLQEVDAGHWVEVATLYEKAGSLDHGIPESLAAAWMPTPAANDEIVVSFYDSDAKWSSSAILSPSVVRRLQTPELATSSH